MSDLADFLFLACMSKQYVSSLLLGGELLLLITSLLVVIGLIGESRSDAWIPAPERKKRWHKRFVLFVTIGVGGELIADGIVFLSSHRLQAIQEVELTELSSTAANANEKAGEAYERASGLEKQTEKLRADAAIALQKQREAERETEKLRVHVSARFLKREDFLAVFKGAQKGTAEIWYVRESPECWYLAWQLRELLRQVGWKVAELKTTPLEGKEFSNSLGMPPFTSVGGQPMGGVAVTATSFAPEDEQDAVSKDRAHKSWVKTPFSTLIVALFHSLGQISYGGGGVYGPPAGVIRIVITPRMYLPGE